MSQGQSLTITVSISNNPSGKGVTGKLSGPGALTKQTSLSIEHDAPASVASTFTAIVTATSAADSSTTATATITVTPAPPALTPTSLPAARRRPSRVIAHRGYDSDPLR